MSVEFQKLRGELFREALFKGWTKPGDVEAPWTSQLAPERIERWYKRLYRAEARPLPVGGRLVNHFMLGADPEFVFHDGMQRKDARAFGLKAGPAFGADNNGRLCELRPQPSRSALSVLASLWLAMRWMTIYHPDTLNCQWRAGGFYSGDGLGGHIHFGRKRTKFRDREVSVLDRLTHLQFVAGIFDRGEGRLRVQRAQGAPAGQPYGALGDIRRQPHGYEYRTLPSWVDNPWLAYFNLVAAKLVVAFPDMVAPLTEADTSLTTERARGQLRMLLAYFSPLDDDARLASSILEARGFPQHASGLDFKANWGLFTGPLQSKASGKAAAVLPEMIPSRPEDENELALSMFEGTPPELGQLEPSWTPHTLPPGYIHLITDVDTKGAPGLGEFAMNLCYHKEAVLTIVNAGHVIAAFIFPKGLRTPRATVLMNKLNLPVEFSADNNRIYINASKDFPLERLLEARTHIVESGLFPLWNISDVKASSYTDWLAQQNASHHKASKVEMAHNLLGKGG
jgi:hypothetical protein